LSFQIEAFDTQGLDLELSFTDKTSFKNGLMRNTWCQLKLVCSCSDILTVWPGVACALLLCPDSLLGFHQCTHASSSERTKKNKPKHSGTAGFLSICTKPSPN